MFKIPTDIIVQIDSKILAVRSQRPQFHVFGRNTEVYSWLAGKIVYVRALLDDAKEQIYPVKEFYLLRLLSLGNATKANEHLCVEEVGPGFFLLA
jgi:hypothetical protein